MCHILNCRPIIFLHASHFHHCIIDVIWLIFCYKYIFQLSIFSHHSEIHSKISKLFWKFLFSFIQTLFMYLLFRISCFAFITYLLFRIFCFIFVTYLIWWLYIIVGATRICHFWKKVDLDSRMRRTDLDSNNVVIEKQSYASHQSKFFDSHLWLILFNGSIRELNFLLLGIHRI